MLSPPREKRRREKLSGTPPSLTRSVQALTFSTPTPVNNNHPAVVRSLAHNAGDMNRPSPLLFFSICAVVDFAIGCIKWHSFIAGVVGIVCGLPLTALAG